LTDKFVLHSKEKCKNIVETIVICYKQRRENSLACNFLTLVANKSRYLSQALSQLSVRVIWYHSVFYAFFCLYFFNLVRKLIIVSFLL